MREDQCSEKMYEVTQSVNLVTINIFLSFYTCIDFFLITISYKIIELTLFYLLVRTLIALTAC